MGFFNKIFRGDRSIWIVFMLLCLVSLVEVYSATSTLAFKNTNYFAPIVKHAQFLLAGFCLALLIHNFPSKYFSVAILLLPVSIGLLLLTMFSKFGVNVNEATRFISFMGVQFQPSEFGKLACIVFVAFMLSKQKQFSPDITFWIIIAGVGITCGLILPDNFSTAALLFIVCYLLMIVGQAPIKKMILLFIILFLSGGLFVSALHYVPREYAKEHLLDRFVTWQGRWDDFANDKSDGNKYAINGDNFQVNHAKIAIARGGIFGKLPGRSVQRDYLPQAYSDFIYAIIIEELGLVIGGIGVLLLYVILMFRVAIIARRCEKLFPKYLALGCGLLIVIQAFINMAVAVNLIPVTGQPLPLISRGGTSTMLTCIYFGIILSVSRFSAGMDETVEKDDEDFESETIETVAVENQATEKN